MSRKTKTTNGGNGMQTNDATEAGTTEIKPRAKRDPNAPPITRPRSGTWTKISKQLAIPGTEREDGTPETTDLKFYRVEFAGQVIEVRRDRAGVKKANDWIRGIKARSELDLAVERIRRKLEEMSEAATSQEMTARLYRASRVLTGDRVVLERSDGEPTA